MIVFDAASQPTFAVCMCRAQSSHGTLLKGIYPL